MDANQRECPHKFAYIRVHSRFLQKRHAVLRRTEFIRSCLLTTPVALEAIAPAHHTGLAKDTMLPGSRSPVLEIP